MDTMKAVYQCRLCECRFYSGTETGPDMALRCMTELNAGVCGTIALAPRMTETHHCGGTRTGSLGVADFLGWGAVHVKG